MIKVAAPLSILAVAVLGACAVDPNNPASTESMSVVAQPMPYYTGSGVVQWVSPAPATAPASASAGATSSGNPAASSDSGMQRLGIRMDDGRMLYVDTPSRDFRPGTRVQLMDSFEIRRL
jgi:hypothetical protein